MDEELERTEDMADTESRNGSEGSRQLGDWARSLRAKAERSRSVVSPWVQGLLSRAVARQDIRDELRPAPGGQFGSLRQVALTQHHTRALTQRVSRKAQSARVWHPDAGAVSPRTFAEFAGEVVQRFPSMAQKYAIEVPESVGEEDDLVLAPVGVVVRGAAPAYAGQPAGSPETQPRRPPPATDAVPGTPVRRRPVARAPRQIQRAPGVRPVSRVEEITPGAKTPVSADSQRMEQVEPDAALEVPEAEDWMAEPDSEPEEVTADAATLEDVPAEPADMPGVEPAVRSVPSTESAAESRPLAEARRPGEGLPSGAVRRAPLPAERATPPDGLPASEEPGITDVEPAPPVSDLTRLRAREDHATPVARAAPPQSKETPATPAPGPDVGLPPLLSRDDGVVEAPAVQREVVDAGPTPGVRAVPAPVADSAALQGPEVVAGETVRPEAATESGATRFEGPESLQPDVPLPQPEPVQRDTDAEVEGATDALTPAAEEPSPLEVDGPALPGARSAGEPLETRAEPAAQTIQPTVPAVQREAVAGSLLPESDEVPDAPVSTPPEPTTTLPAELGQPPSPAAAPRRVADEPSPAPEVVMPKDSLPVPEVHPPVQAEVPQAGEPEASDVQRAAESPIQEAVVKPESPEAAVSEVAEVTEDALLEPEPAGPGWPRPVTEAGIAEVEALSPGPGLARLPEADAPAEPTVAREAPLEPVRSETGRPRFLREAEAPEVRAVPADIGTEPSPDAAMPPAPTMAEAVPLEPELSETDRPAVEPEAAPPVQPSLTEGLTVAARGPEPGLISRRAEEGVGPRGLPARQEAVQAPSLPEAIAPDRPPEPRSPRPQAEPEPGAEPEVSLSEHAAVESAARQPLQEAPAAPEAVETEEELPISVGVQPAAADSVPVRAIEAAQARLEPAEPVLAADGFPSEGRIPEPAAAELAPKAAPQVQRLTEELGASPPQAVQPEPPGAGPEPVVVPGAGREVAEERPSRAVPPSKREEKPAVPPSDAIQPPRVTQVQRAEDAEMPAAGLGADMVARAEARRRMPLSQPMRPLSQRPETKVVEPREPSTGWTAAESEPSRPAPTLLSRAEPVGLQRSLQPPAAAREAEEDRPSSALAGTGEAAELAAWPFGQDEAPELFPAGEESRPTHIPSLPRSLSRAMRGEPREDLAGGVAWRPAPSSGSPTPQVPAEPAAATLQREPLPLPPVIRPAPVEVAQREPVSISPGPVTVQLEIGEPPEPTAEPEQKTEPQVPTVDLEALARQVYPVIKRMLAIERERVWSR